MPAINQNHQLNSHHVYLKYGLQKTMVSYIMQNHFNIPSEYHDAFSIYMIKVWKADKALHLASRGEGTITFLDTQFSVIYKNTSRGRIMAALKANPDLEISLSFRKPQEDIDLYPIVLVSAYVPSKDSLKGVENV